MSNSPSEKGSDIGGRHDFNSPEDKRLVRKIDLRCVCEIDIDLVFSNEPPWQFNPNIDVTLPTEFPR